jgi:hypothetical protein
MFFHRRHAPSIAGVIALFGIVYTLTEVSLTVPQLVLGICAAIIVYSATMVWHVRNILNDPKK